MAVQHYTGSCQCGAIAFEADADLDHTFVCNCSRCRRLGSVLTFVAEEAVSFARDGSAEYRFNQNIIGHRFCPTFGIETHGLGEMDGKRMVAVNVNCLDGVDARSLDSRHYNGAEA